MTDNIDHFNEIVGLVFDQLYRSFPIETDIDEEAIAKALGIEIIDNTPDDWPAPKILNYGVVREGVPFRLLLYATLRWLNSEGFTTGRGEYSQMSVCLSAKALTVLNASPSALSQSLGAKLGEAVKGAGTEAGRSVIGETVGQIIGGFTKSILS
ncbi:hypothetical protein GB927_016605 [Shinella sp. CPCC 100929]|uniref:Uncharacterized protein n=1 Tax=Shinella lacus TaxID=2654216 RepID=A0ABT1R918_9HYPH|nr:hypothetical protein [Shinella lacus]MCQ4631674.1 hypothetical protein [Shinella lacus]